MEPSEFYHLKNIEYFQFEEDFVEENVRCIPMIVRFNMDLAGIKLKLAEWSKFSVTERIQLAIMPCSTAEEIQTYHDYLSNLVQQYTQQKATLLEVQKNPEWGNPDKIPDLLLEKVKETNIELNLSQWQRLTNLQRFALLKLCRPGHENKNFPAAAREFGLLNTKI